MKPYEVLDHTADIGILVYGDSLTTLFENAGQAFFDLISDLDKVENQATRRIKIEGESLDRMMVDWLSELLYIHEVDQLLFKEFHVESVGPHGLKARVRGEPFREGVHVIKTEIKAVTYHQLFVKEENGKWKAQIIFDL